MLKKLRRYLKEVWSMVQLDAWMNGGDEPTPSRFRFAIETARVVLADVWHLVIVNTLCRLRGHDWLVEGHAGPESGYEDFECRRCGEGHHIVYY